MPLHPALLFSHLRPSHLRPARLAAVLAGLATLVVLALPGAACAEGFERICSLLEHERQRDLEDLEIELELVRAEHRARSRVFEMIESLWDVHAVEQEIYLDYKRQRDRTGVLARRFETEIGQKKVEIERFEAVCGSSGAAPAAGGPAVPIEVRIEERIEELQDRYLRFECELLARDVEIAEVDLTFHAAMYEATRVLNERNVKARVDLVVDEFDLEQARARVEGFRRRASACRPESTS